MLKVWSLPREGGGQRKPYPYCKLLTNSLHFWRPYLNTVVPKNKSAPKSKVPQNQKCPKIKSSPKSKVPQNQSSPKSKLPQNQKCPKIKSVPKVKIPQNQKCTKIKCPKIKSAPNTCITFFGLSSRVSKIVVAQRNLLLRVP